MAIDDELGDSALAGAAHNLFGGACYRFNIDFCVRDLVLVEKTFCHPAIGTPVRGVDDQFHNHSLCSVPRIANSSSFCKYKVQGPRSRHDPQWLDPWSMYL